MVKYQIGVKEDLALLAWWYHLANSGDLEATFNRETAALTQFFKVFEAPTELYYEQDDQGFTVASWLTPMMDGAFFSLWIRADKRQSKSSLNFIIELLGTALARYKVLLFVTRNENVMELAKRIGFEPKGEIPYLFDGDTAFVGTLTPFALESATQPRVES